MGFLAQGRGCRVIGNPCESLGAGIRTWEEAIYISGLPLRSLWCCGLQLSASALVPASRSVDRGGFERFRASALQGVRLMAGGELESDWCFDGSLLLACLLRDIDYVCFLPYFVSARCFRMRDQKECRNPSWGGLFCEVCRSEGGMSF